MSDPRLRKRAAAALRRDILALLEEHLQTRRCFWTWPWGHHWETFGGMVTTGSTDWRRVSQCEHCGRPVSWDSFDAHDLLRFAEDKTDIPAATLEPFFDRWRETDR